MDRGAWCATVHGVAKSWAQLSDLLGTFVGGKDYVQNIWQERELRAERTHITCPPPPPTPDGCSQKDGQSQVLMRMQRNQNSHALLVQLLGKMAWQLLQRLNIE